MMTLPVSLVWRIVCSRIFVLSSIDLFCYNVTLFVCGFSRLLCFLLLHVAVVYVERFGRLFHVPVLDLRIQILVK